MAAAKELGGSLWVVKAQVHAGGRGKAGGVKVAKDLEAVRAAAKAMLGTTLVTHQTGPEGLPVHQVYVEVGLEDRARDLPEPGAESRGGAHRVRRFRGGRHGHRGGRGAHAGEDHPRQRSSHRRACRTFRCRQLAFGLGLSGAQIAQFGKIAHALYRLYLERDASLVEVNPLIVTGDGDLLALDAKINIEDNALFRHKDLAAMRDDSQEDPMERKAAEHELNYVSLDGNIACMVNGAGLAMATMDLIQLHGGKPANFLDVGGGATKERVSRGVQIDLVEPQGHARF